MFFLCIECIEYIIHSFVFLMYAIIGCLTGYQFLLLLINWTQFSVLSLFRSVFCYIFAFCRDNHNLRFLLTPPCDEKKAGDCLCTRIFIFLWEPLRIMIRYTLGLIFGFFALITCLLRELCKLMYCVWLLFDSSGDFIILWGDVLID